MSCTLKDIANISGMSISTVSRALNDSPLIKEKTKAKIKAIAKSMNFEFNANARSLIKSETNVIGIIFANNYYNQKTKTFYSTFERYLIDEIEKNGFEAIILSAFNAYTKNSNIKKIINGKKVDGLIIVTRDITEEDLEVLESSDIPFAFLYYPIKETNFNNCSFTVDNKKSGILAAKYLHSQNFKKILMITKETETETNYIDRTLGFLEEAKKLNLEVTTSYSGILFEEGYDFTLENLEEILKYDAIFCQQDYGALGIIKALNENNIKIPEKISILGHDDFESIINMFSPKLTTIKLPFEEMALNSVNYLIGKIKKEKRTIKRKFKSTIIKRES